MASRLFSTLPSEICDFGGRVNAFKGFLDKFFMKIPDIPRIRGYTQHAERDSFIDHLAALRV